MNRYKEFDFVASRKRLRVMLNGEALIIEPGEQGIVVDSLADNNYVVDFTAYGDYHIKFARIAEYLLKPLEEWEVKW